MRLLKHRRRLRVVLAAALLIPAALAVAAVPVGSMTKTADLVSSDAPPGDLQVSGLAMSGGALIASSPARGAAYVFARPATGWSTGTESARLTPSDGKPGQVFGGRVAVSGDAVVVGSGDQAGINALYVFVKPAGGWSGVVHETAELTLRGRAVAGLAAFATSGAAVVAGAPDANHGQGAVYVFRRPTAGWSGTVHASATLTTSRGTADDALGRTVAISGADIIAGASQGGYVFHRPRQGWGGVVHQRARLVTRGWGSLAVTGTSVVAAGGNLTSVRHSAPVFNRPAHGWSGTLLPSTRLKLYLPPTDPAQNVNLAADGDHVVALVYTPPDPHCGGPCGGLADLYSFDRPPGGWHGATHAHTHTLVMSSEDGVLAIGGQAVATADSTIAIYEDPAHA
jgi:hypothetical protein